MVFSKKILSKVMLLFLGFVSSDGLFASVGRASRPLIATGMQASRLFSSSSRDKPIACYFGFDDRTALPYDAMNTKECKLPLKVFDFQRSYDTEMNAAFMNDDQQARFRSYPIIDEKYRRLYHEQREAFDKDMRMYREDRYPKIVSELAVQESDKTDALRKVYENAFGKYKATNPPLIGDYYDTAKCMNAVELQREGMQPRIDLKNYILAFADKRNAQPGVRDRYDVQSVQFYKDRSLHILTPNGSLSAIAQYDWKNGKRLKFSQSFFDQCLTEQALTVMHELGHAKQDSSMLRMGSIAERDADRHAVGECNCPICLKIMDVVVNPMPEGYFKPEDYRQAAQEATHRCTAHQQDTAALEEALARRDRREVEKLDNRRGSILHRLPEIS